MIPEVPPHHGGFPPVVTPGVDPGGEPCGDPRGDLITLFSKQPIQEDESCLKERGYATCRHDHLITVSFKKVHWIRQMLFKWRGMLLAEMPT